MIKLKSDHKSRGKPPLAAFIDNDNIINGIRDQYDNSTGYDIEKTLEFVRDEGNLRIGRVYFNPGDFADSNKEKILHKFNMNQFEPVFTDSYRHKSLTDPNMVWDISEVCYQHPEIEKFVIVSGDKDFLPVIRNLHEKGKDGVLMWVEGCESRDLRETAKKLGWKTYDIPPYKKVTSR